MPDWKKPDWKTLVRERMGGLDLPPDMQANVVEELAAHLEETYESACSQGMVEAAAVEATLQEVNDWHVLSARIRRAKSKEDNMNHRTKSLWLPGMVTLFAASALLMTLQRAGFQPRLLWVGNMAMLFYWPWLAGLPLCGSAGAYLSRRAQAPVLARIAVGISPALVSLIALCLILPWALAVDGFSIRRLVYFAVAVGNWAAIPALALLLGALPFLRGHRVMREAA